MDLGGFFSDLFSGKLFAPKKKKEEQPQTVSVQKPTVSVQPSSPLQPAGIKMPGSLVQEPQTPQFQAPALGGVSQPNTQVKAPLKPTMVAPSLVNKVTTAPTVNSVNRLTPNYTQTADRYSGLSVDDTAIAKNLEAKGKNTDAFITSAREARALKEKSDYQNSFLGKTLNTLGGVGETIISSPVAFGDMLGNAAASYSPEVRALEAQQKANPENPYLAAGLQDIYSGIQEKTNPTAVAINSAGLLLDVLTGNLTGKAAETVVGKGINLAVDPMSLLNKVPVDSFFGKILNKEIGSNLNNAPKVVDNMVPTTNKAIDTEMVGPNKEIGNSITPVPPSSKAPAVTSPAQEAAIAAQTQPMNIPQVVTNQSPVIGGVKPELKATVKPKTQEELFTDKALIVQDITNSVVDRVDNGDIDGARAAANRLYEDPEYGASTPRGQALLERGRKLDEFIKKNEFNPTPAPQVTKTEAPKIVKIFTKSKFNPESKGAYADYPVIRQEDNITLYQGSNPGEQRQYWTPNKKYAEQFGEVKEKTGSFYKVDNGNTMTDVYVEVPSKSTPQVTKKIDTYLDGTPVDPNNPRIVENTTTRSEKLNIGVDDGVTSIHKLDAKRALIKAGYTANESQQIIETVARPGANNISTTRLENAAIGFDKALNGEIKSVIDTSPIGGSDAAIAKKAGITKADSYDDSLTKLDDALDAGKITNDEHAQLEDQLFSSAEKRGEAIAQTADNTDVQAVPYSSPEKGGKASIPGNLKVYYNTGDNTLDAIVNDSIIATKGTAKTAANRMEALERAGISTSQQKQIRDIATKNIDKQTGRISLEAQQKIRNIIAGAETPTTPKMAAKETPKVDTPPVRLKADDEVDAILKQADETFGGGSYGDLVVKQAHNSDQSAPNEILTAAERALNNRIKPQLDAIRRKLNDLGLEDEDLGFIKYISDYLPTRKKDELSSINSVDDVARLDFGFSKQRNNKLSDDEIKEGAEQALREYLRTGELVDELSPEQIKAIKLARKNDETNKLFEQDRNGGSTKMRMTDDEIKQSQIQTEKVVDAEAAKAVAEKKVAEGDTSPASLAERDRTQQQASDAAIEKKVDDYVLLRKKTEERISQIKKDDTINPDSKKQQITQLRAHLADVRNDTYYMQSTVRTNLLLGVGRIADQVNKGVQSVSDAVTGIASKIGANKSFNKVTGRNLYADKTLSNQVYKNVQSNPLLNRARIERQTNSLVTDRLTENKGPVSKFFGKYNQVGTNVTNAGSRYKVVDKDTVSFFTSEAQANGITDVKGITDYVTSKIGTKEWNRTRDVFFDTRNSFTGIPTKGSVTNKNIQVRTKTALYDKLGDISNLSEGARENIADAVTIPIMGFPKLLARLGLKGFDISTFGARDLWKANKIKPQNDADALKKALYVQSAIRNAQSAAALGALGMTAGAADMVTGAYPTDDNERARWQKDKIQPYSLKVGDTYIELGRYAGPLAFPFMIGATLGSKGGSGNIPEVSAAMVSQMLTNFGADSMGDVLVDAGELLSGKKNAGDLFNKYGPGIADAFVPAASLLNTTGKAQDIIQGNAQPDTSAGFVDKFRSKFPFLRDGLPGKTDTLGNPISQGGPATLLPGISGGQSSNRAKTDERQDSVMSEIDRLAKLGYETMPAKDIKNKNSQVDAKALQATKTYQEASDDIKAEYLKETLLGTKTKNINSGLSEAQRTALIEHAIMPTDKRDVWLEDNDNAVNYYSASYDNKKANKTLTANDSNLEYKTGALYLKKKAEVNKAVGADTNLQQLYDKIGQDEWRAMLDDESEDFDLATAEKLMAYDKARTAAGVSGKTSSSSKPKYTEKTAGKGKGGKDFAFASMPSSLIGSSGASKGYADNAPTFKPIADLQAPTGAQIPKGRTISIKKGINL